MNSNCTSSPMMHGIWNNIPRRPCGYVWQCVGMSDSLAHDEEPLSKIIWISEKEVRHKHELS